MNPIHELQKHRSIPLYIEESRDLNYLFPISVTAGQAFIYPDRVELYLDGRYIEQYRSLPYVKPIPQEYTLPEKVAFDGSHLSYQRFQQLKRLYPKTEWINEANPLENIRAIKSEEEKTALRKAASLNSRGYDYVLTLLKEGVQERELAQKLHLFFIENGGERLSFDSIIAFGENSALPHARASARKLKKGDTVLIDIGVRVDNYHSDMCRTVYFKEVHPELKKIYEIVEAAQKLSLDKVREGEKSTVLDETARNYITEKGYGPNFAHSLGHGVGLEIHEFPTLRSKGPEVVLKANMAITIEPGIYIPGLGGVRIEDLVIVQADGYEDLTKRPKELKIV